MSRSGSVFQPGNIDQDHSIKLLLTMSKLHQDVVNSLVILQVLEWRDTNRRVSSTSSGCGERGLVQKTTIKPA